MGNNSEFFCSDCGNPVKKNATKCKNCGAELTEEEAELAGLEGWLFIPTFWLIIYPILIVYNLVLYIEQFPFVFKAGFGIVFGAEILVLIILLAITLYCGFYFFQKRKKTPRLIIIWLKISILFSLILVVVDLLTGADGLAIDNGQQLFRDIISAIIWVPYFKKSKRVKETFTK